MAPFLLSQGTIINDSFEIYRDILYQGKRKTIREKRGIRDKQIRDKHWQITKKVRAKCKGNEINLVGDRAKIEISGADCTWAQ